MQRAAAQLGGPALMRMGMGIMKKGMPMWLADRIPDAPSIAIRFSSDPPDGMKMQHKAGEDLDVLCTAGGNRLWRLLLNLAAGGRMYGLHRFDYFSNIYYADVPYRIDNGSLDVWVRLVPVRHLGSPSPASLQDGPSREQALTQAVAGHAAIRIEVQQVDNNAPFIPIAEIRFEDEIEIDQEALHFLPIAGRGFAPHGLFTELRKSVYPMSAQSRPASAPERTDREYVSKIARLQRFLQSQPINLSEEAAPKNTWSTWLKLAGMLAGAVFVVFGIYMTVRLTQDRPVDYSSDVQHFEYGSTGGERTDGIPYWLWIALPELFPDALPDHTPGRGYSSFGMIYEQGKDPRYDPPVGTSMRNFRGIDVVYLNCGSCHTGTVRDSAGAPPRIIPGMPAHTFNLGAWGKFLTSIPADERFTPQRLLDQISKMQDDPHRLVDKPDLINKLIFRYYAVDLMREQLLKLGDRLSFIHTETWGPGRVDTFNAPKALLNFPMKMYADPNELVGNVDFPSIWNQGPRKGMQLHWDGNNTSVDERNLSAAFGTGAYPPTFGHGARAARGKMAGDSQAASLSLFH